MCGIAGILGGKTKKAIKEFNPTILKMLMLAQDSRGRDNCGVYYKAKEDGERVNRIEWGWQGDIVGPTKTFKTFLANRDLMELSAPYTVIAHSRKGSVGGSGRDNAHPFKCNNIVGVHNGTIREWRSLMDFLNVDVKDIECDSEALFKAISEGKMEDLLKYHPGAATLVWTDIDTGLVYVWCSGSKGTYNSTITADREFHIWPTKAGIYFSSEIEPIEFAMLCTDDSFTVDEPVQVPVNTLMVFENNKLIEERAIKREVFKSTSLGNETNKSGNKTIPKINLVKNTTTVGTTKSTSVSQKSSSSECKSDSSSSTKVSDEVKKDINQAFSNGKELTEFANTTIIPGLEEEPKYSTYFRLAVRNGLYFRGLLLLNSVINFSEPVTAHHMVEYRKLGYWVDTRFYVDSEGDLYWYNSLSNVYVNCNIKKEPVKEADKDKMLTELFFYNGIMMKDESALIEMLEIFSEAKKEVKDSGRNIKLNPKMIASFAAMPVWNALSYPSKEDFKFYTFGLVNMKTAIEKGYQWMQGYFHYPFTDTVYKFEAGVPTELIKWQDNMTCIDSPEEFESFREGWTGSFASYVYKSNGSKTDMYTTGCPSCGSIHKLKEKELKLAPACFKCGTPILVQDEKYFPETKIKV